MTNLRHLSKMNRRNVLLGAPALILTACVKRADIVEVPPQIGGAIQPIFVVTDREVDQDFYPTDRRAAQTSFGRVDVRVPATHSPGQVEYPTAGRDNRTAFGATETHSYETPLELLSDLGVGNASDDPALIFIHGFNNTMAEGVYRHAQIAHDLSLTGPQISYSWPSTASSVGYLADRDSVAISRDGLETLIHNLATRQNRKINILAHSMGTLLLMETLRQMSISGNSESFDALAGVVLMAPDINIDLFERQVARINPMPSEFIVALSSQDRALQLSQFLSGDADRLGRASDIARLEALGIEVVDLSEFGDGDAGNHATLVSSPSALALIRRIRASQQR